MALRMKAPAHSAVLKTSEGRIPVASLAAPLPNMMLSVVIVNWNTRDLLWKCLTSINASKGAALGEIWVVDNASADGSAEMVEREFPSVKLVRNQTNVGFSTANNQAIRMAAGKYILLLNPDTEIVGNATDTMIDFMENHREVGAVGCKLLNSDGSLQRSCHSFSSPFKAFTYALGLHSLVQYNRFSKWLATILGPAFPSLINVGNYDTILYPDWILGACMLVRKDLLVSLGFLDEGLFMYADDEDLCYRLIKHGYKVAFIPNAVVIHHGGQSSRLVSEIMAVESWKSRILFFQNHFGRGSTAALRLAIFLGTGARLLSCLLLSIFNLTKQRQNISICLKVLVCALTFPISALKSRPSIIK